MADIVVDASVVAKWYIPERHHEPARALRDGYFNGRHTLRAPAVLPFEVVNALKYSGHYAGDRLVEASRTLPEYGIDLVPYHETGPVAEVAADLDVPLYDASYLALAQTTDATVYTADSGLLEATDSSSVSECSSHICDYTTH
ncbi:MAG: type II toxin-antitoxin system VapC family toxin [Haloarculaceae archaeon]